MGRRLSLKSEHLAELTTDDLRAVVGGDIPTVKTYCEMIRQILNPPSHTHVCSDECF